MPSTFTPIVSTTVSSATTTVSFTSIPQTYTDLFILLNIADSASGYVLVRYNNDSTTLYSRTGMYGDGSNPQAFRQTGQTSHFVASGATVLQGQKIQINNYSNTNTFKSSVFHENRTDSTVGLTVGLYRSTSAISRIDFISPTGATTIAANSVITLYGIKAA